MLIETLSNSYDKCFEKYWLKRGSKNTNEPGTGNNKVPVDHAQQKQGSRMY